MALRFSPTKPQPKSLCLVIPTNVYTTWWAPWVFALGGAVVGLLLTLARGRPPAARAAHPPPSRRTITRTRTGALDVSDAELPGTWWGWLTGC